MGIDRTSHLIPRAKPRRFRFPGRKPPQGPHWNLVCPEDWDPWEHAALGDGLRRWEFLLAAAQLAKGRSLAKTTRRCSRNCMEPTSSTGWCPVSLGRVSRRVLHTG